MACVVRSIVVGVERGAFMRRYLFLLPAALLAASWTLSPVGTPPPAQGLAGHVILAVGDMACDPSNPRFQGGLGDGTRCAEQQVSDQMSLDASGYEAVLGLGDYQYDCGDLADYEVSYNPTFGRFDSMMEPSLGNHEYKTRNDVYGQACPSTNATAQSYFQHFGASAHPESAGHYSFDIGSWHFVALNANCTQQGVGGCAATSAQTTWLKNDLAAVDPVAQPCVAAFWHQPLWTGLAKNASPYRPWWKVLYRAHADVVLNGHVHNYQRFAPLDPMGNLGSSHGITEYVV